MASKMTEVAKLLGVEFDEEFCTTESSVKYKLTKRCLQAYNRTRACWEDASYTLTRLLVGYISDDKYYNLGLVFKSKEEAIALGQKMLAVAKEEVCR